MGIPDTYAMPIVHSQIFTATTTAAAEETSSSTQEHLPLFTRIFRTAFFYNKKDKVPPDSSVSINGDSSSINFACDDIKKATNIKKFTHAEIKKATANYNKQNIIGQGGSGKVYKGVLSSNQLIAVKRLCRKQMSIHVIEQFLCEINVLSQINHKNVVKLLGGCFEKEVPSIIYEYIPNGSLYDHLFEQNPCVLTWNHRLRIGAQVAQVLAYLHTTTRIPIIHRDIKSSNILLGPNYMAKVCDFGISKLGPCQDEYYTFVESEDTWEWDGVSTCVTGTFGYLDPEYFQTSKVTTKSDVYSFGVVLAELLTRKNAVCKEWPEEKILAFKFLQKLKDDSLVEIVDEQLLNEGYMEQVMKVAHLAGRCLELKGEDRPTMRQVVRDLENIRGF